MRRNFNAAMTALVVVLMTTAAPALARGNDLVIKDGFGEELTVKNGLFGRKTTTVKDRLGNGYSTKSGLFGSKDTSVNVLGNTVQRKKGWFGSSEVKGSTIFGDKVTTKKGLFGRRTTEVDVSGTSSVLRDLWAKHGPSLMGKTNPKQQPNSNLNSPATGLDSQTESSLPANNDLSSSTGVGTSF